jgi:single-strand DNA-binding protein
MSSYNKVMLMGNLTRDIEVRYTPRGTAVADICIAINRTWKDDNGAKQEDTTFVDCTLWGKTAELAAKYLAKGRGIFLEGRLTLESWEDKDSGKKRTKLKVIGETIQFLPSGDPSSRPSAATSSRQEPRNMSVPSNRSTTPASQPCDEDDDIPF